MPYVRTQDWTNYMVLKDVPDEVRQEAARLDLELVRHNPHHTEDALKGRDIDHLGALAVRSVIRDVDDEAG